MSYLPSFADHVALAYHEARNVRHLVKAGKIDPAPWQSLVALPTNRVAAWAAIQPLREEARTRQTRSEVICSFEKRFHISLAQLRDMYGNEAWRGSAYGGNAWENIARLLLEIAEAPEGDLGSILDELLVAQHNTGSVAGKLEQLDAGLIKSGTAFG